MPWAWTQRGLGSPAQPQTSHVSLAKLTSLSKPQITCGPKRHKNTIHVWFFRKPLGQDLVHKQIEQGLTIFIIIISLHPYKHISNEDPGRLDPSQDIVFRTTPRNSGLPSREGEPGSHEMLREIKKSCSLTQMVFGSARTAL